MENNVFHDERKMIKKICDIAGGDVFKGSEILKVARGWGDDYNAQQNAWLDHVRAMPGNDVAAYFEG